MRHALNQSESQHSIYVQGVIIQFDKHYTQWQSTFIIQNHFNEQSTEVLMYSTISPATLFKIVIILFSL